MERDKTILAVDPGLRQTGWAFFDCREWSLMCSGVLRSVKADWVNRLDQISREFTKLVRSHNPGKVLIELPRHYSSQRGSAAKNSDSILKLTGLVFALRTLSLCQGVPVQLVGVGKWKGQVPKKVIQRRIRHRWNWNGSNHNEADAVGIGDWYLRDTR